MPLTKYTLCVLIKHRFTPEWQSCGMFHEIFEDHFEDHIRAPEASLLYLQWRMAKGNRAMPEEGDIPEHRIAYLKPDLMILRPCDEADWIYEHYGAAIAAQTGFDMTGRRVGDFQGALRDFFVAVYGRVMREQRPLASVHRFGDFGETPLWERLILPFGRGDTVTVLLVVNKVREIAQDISHLAARARERGMMVLQFMRDGEGAIIDAMIAGANLKACIITGRRADELIGHTMLTRFPGLRDAGLWARYLAVAEAREPQMIEIPYHADGVEGTFAVEIAPLLDGVTIAFEDVSARHRLGAENGQRGADEAAA